MAQFWQFSLPNSPTDYFSFDSPATFTANAPITANSLTGLVTFQLTTGADSGYILKSDASGVASWTNNALGWTYVSPLIITNDSVAIGASALTGTERMRVTAGAVLFDGSVGVVPTSGAGTRLFWAPAKAALRAGIVTGTQWDNANVGVGSVAFGGDTIASADYSTAIGFGARANLRGEFALASFMFNTPGDVQLSTIFMGRRTTNATPVELTLDGFAPASSNRIVLKQKTTYTCVLVITARNELSLSQSAGFEFSFIMDRQVDADSVSFVQGREKKLLADDTGMWDVSLDVDTINSSLRILVTGQMLTTILWAAKLEMTMVSSP